MPTTFRSRVVLVDRLTVPLAPAQARGRLFTLTRLRRRLAEIRRT